MRSSIAYWKKVNRKNHLILIAHPIHPPPPPHLPVILNVDLILALAITRHLIQPQP